MPVQGLMFVAGKPVQGAGAPFHGIEAATGASLDPQFATASAGQVEAALASASAAAPAFAASAPRDRAALLEPEPEGGHRLYRRVAWPVGCTAPGRSSHRWRPVVATRGRPVATETAALWTNWGRRNRGKKPRLPWVARRRPRPCRRDHATTPGPPRGGWTRPCSGRSRSACSSGSAPPVTTSPRVKPNTPKLIEG